MKANNSDDNDIYSTLNSNESTFTLNNGVKKYAEKLAKNLSNLSSNRQDKIKSQAECVAVIDSLKRELLKLKDASNGKYRCSVVTYVCVCCRGSDDYQNFFGYIIPLSNEENLK